MRMKLTAVQPALRQTRAAETSSVIATSGSVASRDGPSPSSPPSHGWWTRGLGVLVLVAALAASACGSSGGASTSSGSGGGSASGPLNAPTRAKVEQTIRQFKHANKTPGVLVGIWSPRGTFVSATGVANLATKQPLSSDMQFKVASQSKGFTATLILQLVGEGKVSLDDHISKWVAGVPNGSKITIRELLTMTSGLGPGFLSAPGSLAKLSTTGCTETGVLATAASRPPVAPPATKWVYSNYGYDLLGRVVELTTGRSMSAAIQQRIAGPLGLHRTFLPTSGNGLSAPFTHGYGVGEARSTRAPAVASDDATALKQGSCLGASGGMVSTLSDLRVWVRAFATGALLKPAVWRKANKGPFPFAFPDNRERPA
jgi:D-alanyl-D-alanine carboxypeptidase